MLLTPELSVQIQNVSSELEISVQHNQLLHVQRQLPMVVRQDVE